MAKAERRSYQQGSRSWRNSGSFFKEIYTEQVALLILGCAILQRLQNGGNDNAVVSADAGTVTAAAAGKNEIIVAAGETLYKITT